MLHVALSMTGKHVAYKYMYVCVCIYIYIHYIAKSIG